MPKVAYQDLNFRPAKLKVIEQVNNIIAIYAAQGFSLTLRQTYYQFVSRGLIPNNDREYKNLGSAINDGRLAGLIDWEAIVDRTRNVRDLSHWSSPAGVIASALHSYHTPKWDTQPAFCEVWIEKDALVGVIEGVCQDLDVPYFSCRGYTSQSEMWAAAQRLIAKEENGQETYIFHLGDHDPSGRDMSRDIQDRLNMFGSSVDVQRIALNWDQIQQYSPPPNPAKITDSRSDAYIAEFGNESWELDALEPTVIAQLIRDAVESIRDDDEWETAVAEEKEHKKLLTLASNRWSKVATFLQGL